MIKENQKYFNRMHVVIDAIVVVVSFFLAYFLRFESGIIPITGYFLPIDLYYSLLPFFVVGYLILYYIFNLYTPKRYQARRYELSNLIKANFVGLILLFIVLYLMRNSGSNYTNYFSTSLFLLFVIINICLDCLVRNIIRYSLRAARKKGMNLKHMIIVGFSPAAAAYLDRLKANPQWGYFVHGIFDDNLNTDFDYRGYKCIGNLSELNDFLDNNALDETVIALSIKEYAKLEGLVKACEKAGVHTKFVPDYYNFISTNPYTEDLNGLPVINIRNVPLSNTPNMYIKRIIDIFGAIVAIILFSPVMLLTTIIIKITSPGPVIFKQVRIGLQNKEFNMYKFRSMEIQKASDERKAWTTPNDPRVTPFGKFIRKFSIDELPQLFNVLKGDMSMVGPRPERPFFVEKFKEEIPRYMIKHQVRPGITGWAQINGYRGDTSIRGRIDHDLYYIENWTLGLDFKILFLTIFKGFVNPNAY